MERELYRLCYESASVEEIRKAVIALHGKEWLSYEQLLICGDHLYSRYGEPPAINRVILDYLSSITEHITEEYPLVTRALYNLARGGGGVAGIRDLIVKVNGNEFLTREQYDIICDQIHRGKEWVSRLPISYGDPAMFDTLKEYVDTLVV